MNFIKTNLSSLQKRIKNASNLCERNPESIQILAVSKKHSLDLIKIAYGCGLRHFGENYVQEALGKIQDFNPPNINWHFIGRIQTNKIRKIVQNFRYIHSVDSFEKLQKISDISYEEKKNPSIMLQIKLSDDPTKGGFNPEFLMMKWSEIQKLKNITLIGLMTINPRGLSSTENFKLFKKCRSLADSLKLPDCSMGMSGDWEEAIEAGSTWLRLGSLIFGNRY